MKAILINNMTSGGAEKVVLTLLDEFRKEKEPMHLICVGRDQFYEIPENIQIHYLTDFDDLPTDFTKIFYLFLCAFRLKKLIIQHQITLVQSHLIAASFINIIAKSFGGAHFAQVVIHSWINFDHKNILKKWLSLRTYGWLFRNTDSIISISEVMKRGVDNYFQLEQHPMHQVIHNPHPIQEIQKLSKEPIDDFFFDKNKKYLVTACRLTKGKRIEVILEALKKLRIQYVNVELIIIGDGPEKLNYEKITEELELKSVVHFLGYRTNPFSYLAAANIFVMSSEWEGLPNILIESMICGTPVISSDCISGPREILHPHSDIQIQLKDKIEIGEFGVLYPVGSIDWLVKAVELLLTNQNQYQTYEQKGIDRIKKFEASFITLQYINTFPNSGGSKEFETTDYPITYH